MDDSFLEAVEKVLGHEGGYVNDPHDPGGETNFGISKRSYPSLDIKNLTREKAIEIYRVQWWERYGYELVASPDLAAKVFDLAVNMGQVRAAMILQEAVNRTSPASLKVDGQIGIHTLEAVNNHPHPSYFLAEFKLGAIAYYLGLQKERFLAGWVRRALD